MTMIIRNNKVYAGSGGGSGNANIVKVTQAEYDALPESKNNDGVLYAITDGESQSAGEDADMVIYTEEDGSKTTVQDKLSELNQSLPFKLAVDSDGNYGYIKAGADTVTPFSGNGLDGLTWARFNSNYNDGGAKAINLGGKPSYLFIFGWDYNESLYPIYQYGNGKLTLLYDPNKFSSGVQIVITETGFTFNQTRTGSALRMTYAYKI